MGRNEPLVTNRVKTSGRTPAAMAELCLHHNGTFSEDVARRKAFFDRIAEAWEEEHGQPEQDAKLKRILDRSDLRPGQMVLDAGCGTGRLIPLVLKKIGNSGRLVAVDVSTGMLDIARKKFSFRNVSFCQADVTRLDVREFFDRIICLALLPHLPDKTEALLAFRKYLRRGGQLIIAHTAGREEINRFHSALPEPINRDLIPEKQEMIRLLRETGFSLLEFEDSDLYFLKAEPAQAGLFL